MNVNILLDTLIKFADLINLHRIDLEIFNLLNVF